MRTILFLLTAWMGLGNAAAQVRYQRYYRAGGAATRALSEMASGNLFIGMADGNGFSILDPQGMGIHSHCFDLLPFLVIQSVRKHADNELYFAGGYQEDSCSSFGSLVVPYTDPVIGRMDSLGEVQSAFRYRLNTANCSNTALDLQVMDNRDVVAWGRYQTFSILRADSNGAALWSKQFPHHGSFGFVRELPGGDLLAGINMDTAGMAVARLNAAGEFLWCKSYIRPKGMANDCLVRSDDSFIITGYTDSIFPTGSPWPPDYQPELFLMELDGEGEVQWCRGYANPQRWDVPNGSRIVQAQDGNYVVLGGLGPRNARQPFLMKTDQYGDTLWTRSTGGNGFSHSVVSLLASEDGGYFYNGGAYGPFVFGDELYSSAAYLFKTDSMGYLPCHNVPPPAVTVLDLFPVDSAFTLTWLEGAEAFPITLPDESCGPMATEDGCVISSVNEPAVRASLSIRPNPNTGRFTVAFSDPLLAESWYGVYDALGRLLFQRPWPKGKQEEEVDLARFGSGTYVVKFTGPDGVCHERVVVE